MTSVFIFKENGVTYWKLVESWMLSKKSCGFGTEILNFPSLDEMVGNVGSINPTVCKEIMDPNLEISD